MHIHTHMCIYIYAHKNCQRNVGVQIVLRESVSEFSVSTSAIPKSNVAENVLGLASFFFTMFPLVPGPLVHITCCCLVFKSCLTFLPPYGLSKSLLPGSSVHGISYARYWSGLPFPSPRDLSNPGIKPTSLALAGGLFTTEPPGKPISQN